jgi:phosphatidylglycerophosphate synthase
LILSFPRHIFICTMIESLKPFFTRCLGPFAKTAIALRLHPNAVTALGVVFSAVAAWHIARGAWFLSAVFIGLCACMDGLDGLLANITNKKTRFGAIFDSTADRITEILWFFGLLFFYCAGPAIDRTGIYVTCIALCGSMMVSYVRARCEGVSIRCNDGLFQRPERIIILLACLLLGRKIMIWGLLLLSCAAWATVMQRLFLAYAACKKYDDGVTYAGQSRASEKSRTDHQPAVPA